MDYVKVLQDIIAIDTSVPPGLNYDQAVDYLEPLFRQVGFTTQKVTIPKQHADGQAGRVNLIAHRANRGKPHLIFYGHIDVVPAEGWDAFNPRVEGGKIIGRGAADMKGSIAALLQALDLVKDESLQYAVSVMITTDEEVGQAPQLRYLAQYIKPVKGAFLFDLDSSFGYAGIANLGAVQMDILVHGKSVHSALSHMGENAVENASLLIAALLKLKKKVMRRKSKIKVHPETGLKFMEDRLNINMIKGGIKVNIVPDECRFSIDRRLIPEENLEDAAKELIDTMNAVPGVRWEIENLFTIPAVLPCEDPLIDKLVGIIKEVTGSGGKYGEMGSGDLPQIVAEWGGKTFGLGVIRSESNMHGKDEFVYQQDVADVAQIISKFLTTA